MRVAGFGVFKVETVEICRINIELIEAAVSGCFLMNESLVGSSASGDTWWTSNGYVRYTFHWD